MNKCILFFNLKTKNQAFIQWLHFYHIYGALYHMATSMPQSNHAINRLLPFNITCAATKNTYKTVQPVTSKIVSLIQKTSQRKYKIAWLQKAAQVTSHRLSRCHVVRPIKKNGRNWYLPENQFRQNLSFWNLSELEFLTIWFFFVLSQFEFKSCHNLILFVYHNLRFWCLSQC